MPRSEQDKLFSVLKDMTRGDAAKFINSMLIALRSTAPSKTPLRKPINLDDVRNSIKDLEKKKTLPLPSGMKDLGVLVEDMDKQRTTYKERFIEHLRKQYPNISPIAIMSMPEHKEILAKEYAYFSAWYKENVGVVKYRTLRVGNATIRFREGSLPEGSISIVTNALNHLQKSKPLGGMPIEVTYDSPGEVDRIAGTSNTAGVAWSDSFGGHIVLSEKIIGTHEPDQRPGRKGYVSNELATIIHEYGHLFHEAVVGSTLTKDEESDLALEFQKKFKGTYVTDYGQTNHIEQFAEMFFDAVYSEMDEVEPAIPEFAEFLKSLEGRQPRYRRFKFPKFGRKKVNRRELPPENTTPEFAGATLLSGKELELFEQSNRFLKGTDQEAGYIPDESDEAAYQKFKKSVSAPGITDDQHYRDLFAQKIAEAKKDARRYKVLRVNGTNSYIRWKSGDATPDAIQQAVDQMRELSDFNSASGTPNFVTLSKRGTFTISRLFESAVPGRAIHGFSFANNAGVFIVANPDEVYSKPNIDGRWYAAGGPDAPNMLARTLVHEYAHGWAIAMLGHMMQKRSDGSFVHHERFVEFMNLFPDIQGLANSHPISTIGFDNHGESFAEYFTAAFFQVSEALSLPDSKSSLLRFMKFFSKYSKSAPIKVLGTRTDPQEMSTTNDLKFPKVYSGGSAENLMLEFDARREFYRNGLSPYGGVVGLKHSSLLKNYFAVLEEEERLYQESGSQEDKNYFLAGVATLKKFYDAMFFTHAKTNSRFNSESISNRISTEEGGFRKWKSATSAVGVADSRGLFENIVVSGSYEDNSGTEYPMIYLNSKSEDGKETAVAVAIAPKYAGVDHTNMPISDILDHSVGLLIAGSGDGDGLILNHVSVTGDNRRKGIATALLAFARGNNTSSISHPVAMTPDASAWAQSVDGDPKNFVRKPLAFDDIYGVASQNRHADNIIAKAADVESVAVEAGTLDAESIYYAGESYGEVYHPNLENYTSADGGGLGVYQSTVGYVSARLLSSMKGNEPSVPGSVESKVEDLQDGDGFDQPVSVAYNPRTGEAYVADGNHRVQASLDAGVAYVPTRVFVLDAPPVQKQAQLKKLVRDGGLPLPTNALEVHPYFVFNRADLINSDADVSETIVQEMSSNQAIWTSKVTPDSSKVRPEFRPDPENIFEQLAPGEFVMDKKTGQIYKVYGQDIEEAIDEDGNRVVKRTDKIVVRRLDGLLDQLESFNVSTGNKFNAAGIRYARSGSSSADDNYNDIRIYTDEIRDPNDFTNVTESFMKLSDQPILVSDTMFVVQRETGIKGRISGFVSPGVVRLDVLKGYDEDDDPIYEQVEVPVSEILPIQNQRESFDTEKPMEQAADMKLTKAQWDAINSLSSTLLKWGYLSEEKYKAIQMSLHAGFITRSGATDLQRDLMNFDAIRRSKIRKNDVRVKADSPSESAQVEQGPVAAETPTTSVDAGKSGGRSFEELLNLKMKRKAADRGVSSQEFSSPVTKSDVVSGQPSPSQLLEVERLLSEDGVVSNERASQIAQSLPILNADAVAAILDELRAAALNKRISNDQEISGISIPEGFNTSKLINYVPTKDADGNLLSQEMASDDILNDGEDEYSAPRVPLSPEQKATVDSVLHADGGSHLIMGGAGSGKSTVIAEIERQAKNARKSVLITAPTGVAAINVNGVTINSAFRFPTTALFDMDMPAHVAELGRTKSGRKALATLKFADMIVVDEVSMVNPDTVDAMDRMLRLVRGNMAEPFGGAKMVFVGDPFQLAPVPINRETNPVEAQRFDELYQSNFFFDANVWAANPFDVNMLSQIFRQDEKSDPKLVSILNAMREGQVSQEDLDYLNDLGRKNMEEIIKNKENGVEENVIRLVTKNSLADAINDEGLKNLEGASVKFTGTFQGDNAAEDFAKLSGTIPAAEMEYKVGEPVMFVKNDDAEQRKNSLATNKRENRWVNGTVGTIVGFKTIPSGDGEPVKVVIVEVDGVRHDVVPATWTKNGYTIERGIEEGDEKTVRESVVPMVEQTFTQIPLKPAWAITIHKAQGKTLDKFVLDFSDVVNDDNTVTKNGPFAAGQTYVGLSRGTGAKSFGLTRDLRKSDILAIDGRLKEFMGQVAGSKRVSEESSLTEGFDPLKGFQTAAEIETALKAGEIKGPNGERLTEYQRNTLLGKIQKMKDNPNSADRYRLEIEKLMKSWFGVDGSQEMASPKKSVEVNMDSFTDPAERQAVLDMLSKSGIPYNLRYDS
jgi:ATP-dependent exoDNAse (exonuclease V) alpha subunit/DNA-binding protein H-NS